MAYHSQDGGGHYGGGDPYGAGYGDAGHDGYGNGGYGDDGYGGGGGGYGQGGQHEQQWSDPPPQQRRPPPQGYDNYIRGPGRGAPRNDSYHQQGPAPGHRAQAPPQNQGYDRGYDPNQPFSPADSQGGQGHSERQRPGPARGAPGPRGGPGGDPRYGDPAGPPRSAQDEYSRRPNPTNYERDGPRTSHEHRPKGPGEHQQGRQQRPNERILETPISPEERSWDNPFPTFPSKKAAAKEEHKSHRGEQHQDRPQSHESAHSRRQYEANIGDGGGREGAISSQSLPTSHPESRSRSNGARHGGSGGQLDFDLPRPPPQVGEQRSNTMPDRGFPDLNQQLPKRGHNEPPGPGNPGDGRSFSFEGPLSPPKPHFEGRRADSAGAMERFDRSGTAPQGYGGQAQHSPDQYDEVFDDYVDHQHPENGPWSPGEEMPNFDGPTTALTNEFDSLHMGGYPQGGPPQGMRGPDSNRGPYSYDDQESRSRSQPNFRQPPQQGYGGQPDMPPTPQGGFGPGGNRGPPPGRGTGFNQSDTWGSNSPGPGAYGGPAQPGMPRGPPRGPLPQFKPRPKPGGAYGAGTAENQQRMGPAAPGGPPSRPHNPDALPSHPAPVRPGLMQQPTGPPPAQAQARQQAPPMGIMRAETMQQPVSASAPPPQKPAPMPVTIDDLRRLRQHVMNQPGDQPATLELSKKLVEASSTLIGDKGRVDPKVRAKNRDKFLGEAFKHLKKLASYNYPDAMFFLADCYGRDAGGRGLFTPLPDQKEAFMLYQAAAKANHGQAAYRVAVCCEMGQDEGGGTRRDPLKALQWYRRAAALGDPPAMYKMGIILLKGLLGQQRNPAEAIGYLQQAAERADADNPHALHELGLLYESGSPTDGVPLDDNYARQLFVQCAQLGYKFSQYRLGSAFEYGTLGCPVDPRQSIAWYSKAAIQEEHQSELALSGWYLTGSEGVIQQSDTEAYLWARKAAQAGLSKAEYAMGYFTEVGIGAPADLESAKRWYWRAASQNYPKARERLEDLRKGGARMQKAQVSRSDVKNNQGECSVM